MKKQLLLPKMYSLAAGLLACALFTSCTGDDGPKTEPEPVASQYAIATVAGAFPNQTTYIQGLNDLNVTAVTTNNATEMPKAAGMHTFKGNVYMSSTQPATMKRFTIAADGRATETGTLVVDGSRAFSTVQFVSDTEAYASVYGTNSIIKFNPTTMQKTGEVDITSLNRPEAPTLLIGESIVRDNKMFLSVHYEKNFAAVFDAVFVAIVDLSTGQLEKLITDGRTKTAFGSGRAVQIMTMDQDKNIYLQGMGDANRPSGIVRIKAGQTEFDPNYFFDLNAATGKQCYGLYHFGPGQTFTLRLEDPTKFWSSSIPSWKFWKIDLVNRTSGGELSATIPMVAGASTSLMRKFDDNTILLNAAGQAENAIYEYNITTGAVQKKFSMTGVCRGLEKIK